MTSSHLQMLAQRAFDSAPTLQLRTLLTLCAGRLLIPRPLTSDTTATADTLLLAAHSQFPGNITIRELPSIASLACLSDLIAYLYTQPTPTLPSMMAEISEHLIDHREAKKRGAFYTPAILAKRMAEQSLRYFSKGSPHSIADISCGSGIFLLEAQRAVFSANTTCHKPALYGVDLDTQALECARILLQLQELHYGIPVQTSGTRTADNIRCGNSLVDPCLLSAQEFASLSGEKPLSFEQSFPEVFRDRQGFDLIIGNPPYGLSRSERICPEGTRILKRLYSNRIGGRINTYLLFILRAYELLAPGGVLSLVVPNSWLAIDEAKKVRELLLHQGALSSIDFFVQNPFKSLGVEVITFIAQKSRQAESISLRTFESPSSELPIKEHRIPRNEILTDISLRIPLSSDTNARRVIGQIEKMTQPLGLRSSPFRASIALQAYAAGRGTPPQNAETVRTHPFHVTSKSGPECIPYLQGRDIRRLTISWSGTFLKYGPWLAEHHPIERYTTPRILVREILAPAPRLIQATFVAQPFTYNRSVLHIHSRAEPDISALKALTLLLNSTTASFWLLQRGRKAQRSLFPKILARDLNEFPIPPNFDSVKHQLAEFYDSLAFGDSNNFEQLLGQIDLIAIELYNLDSAECIGGISSGTTPTSTTPLLREAISKLASRDARDGVANAEGV